MWMCTCAGTCALTACNYVYYAKHVGTPLSCRCTGLGLAVSTAFLVNLVFALYFGTIVCESLYVPACFY